jgi:hypothetical protein
MNLGSAGAFAGATRLRAGVSAGLVASALALLLGAGCATVGRDFPVAAVANILIGETDRDEIRAAFGPPWRVGIEDGQTTWTYGKYRYRLFGERSTTDLVVRFDDRGIVRSYSFSTTEHDEGQLRQ